ncbi:TPA: tetratricopeptide repeat protein, partial [Candidatus Poribacteria bacterium]|nr:tetratricopeptide repeat protein [Candidatus Poribacteria bacterium]
YHKINKLDKAVVWYRRAVGLHPENERFKRHLTAAVAQMGDIGGLGDNEGWDLISAFQLLRGGRAEEALKVISEIESSHAFYLKGMALLMLQRYNEAKKMLRKAMGMGLEDQGVLYHLGVAHAATGKLFSAVTAWERALKLDPETPIIKNALMKIYHQLADQYVIEKDALEKAVPIWRKLLRLNPKDEVARNNLVRAYFLEANEFAREGELNKAINRWKRIVELMPDNADALHNLALAHDKLGDPITANDYWEKVIKIWKKRERSAEDRQLMRERLRTAYEHLADNYMRVGFTGNAIRALKSAAATASDDFDLFFSLGNLLMNEGRMGEAISEFQKALRIKPDDPEVLFRMGEAYEELRQYMKAARCYEKILEREPDNRDIIYQYCACYAYESEKSYYTFSPGKMLRLIREGLKRVPQAHMLRAFLVRVYLSEDDRGKAQELIDEGTSLFPEDPDLYIELAFSMMDLNPEDAERYSKKALELDRESFEIPLDIAVKHVKMGVYDEVDGYLREALNRAEEDDDKTFIFTTLISELMDEEPKLARKYSAELVRLFPDFGPGYLLMGFACYFCDKEKEAVKWLNRGIKRLRKSKGEHEEIIRLMETMKMMIRLNIGLPDLRI